MKRFNFSLQRVLEFREFQKKTAQGELAKALSKETTIQNKIEATAQSCNLTAKTVAGSTDFSQLQNASTYINYLRGKRLELLEDMANAKQQSQEKRQALVSCMQKQKVLEKLKQKKTQEHKDAEQKSLDIAMDDIATAKKRQ